MSERNNDKNRSRSDKLREAFARLADSEKLAPTEKVVKGYQTLTLPLPEEVSEGCCAD